MRLCIWLSSKNKLTFTMNSVEGKENMSATADVTVYDVANKFRLAVFEVRAGRCQLTNCTPRDAPSNMHCVCADCCSHWDDMVWCVRVRRTSQN